MRIVKKLAVVNLQKDVGKAVLVLDAVISYILAYHVVIYCCETCQEGEG